MVLLIKTELDMPDDKFASEFLYHDPDSGMVITMILDGDGFRPVTAMEESVISQEWAGMPMQGRKSKDSLEMAHGSLGDFISRYARSFCMDAESDLAGWDSQPQSQSPC